MSRSLPPRTNEECIAHRKMGAYQRAYSFIELMGCVYGLCYRCVQDLCDVGRPVRDEMYQLTNPTSLGPSACMPKAGKHFRRDIVIVYETPAEATKTATKPV